MLRSPLHTARALVQSRHYRALWRMLHDCPEWPRVLRAYLTNAGVFPMDIHIATPLGERAIRLHVSDDVLTLNEIFFRRDYPIRSDAAFVLDLGANIGLSALWFLTRGPRVRCELYEPVPANIAKLRETLAGLESRYTIYHEAVSDATGSVRFGIEPTGRYGGIRAARAESITVPCVHINDAIDRALEHTPQIDLLKVDIEGAEHAVLAAITPERRLRIDRIVVEVHPPHASLDVPGFAAHRVGSVSHYHNTAVTARTS